MVFGGGAFDLMVGRGGVLGKWIARSRLGGDWAAMLIEPGRPSVVLHPAQKSWAGKAGTGFGNVMCSRCCMLVGDPITTW